MDKNNRKYTKDMISAGLFAAFSLIIIFSSSGMQYIASESLGPGFIPRLVSGIMLILSISLFVKTLAEKKKEEVAKQEIVSEKTKPESGNFPKERFICLLCSILMMIIYALALKRIGFIICNVLFLFLQMILLAPPTKRNRKNLILYAVIAVMATIMLYYAFTRWFKIILPRGLIQL